MWRCTLWTYTRSTIIGAFDLKLAAEVLTARWQHAPCDLLISIYNHLNVFESFTRCIRSLLNTPFLGIVIYSSWCLGILVYQKTRSAFLLSTLTLTSCPMVWQKWCYEKNKIKRSEEWFGVKCRWKELSCIRLYTQLNQAVFWPFIASLSSY